MSKTKTALQILAEWVSEELVLEGYEHREILRKIKSLLPTERQQIEDAHNDKTWDESATDYFTQTYKE